MFRLLQPKIQKTASIDFYNKLGAGGKVELLPNGRGTMIALQDGTVITHRINTSTPNSPAVDINVSNSQIIVSKKVHFIKEEKAMIEMKLTDEMIEILKSIKGKKILSLQCAKIDEWSRTYGNFRINFIDFSIDFTNEIRTVPFFDSIEDVAGFECVKTNNDTQFTPKIDRKIQVVPFDEEILSIEIINDEIEVNNGEYQVSFDEAILIHTEARTIMFAKTIWFSELIYILFKDDYDKIYSVESVKRDWSNGGDYKVSVKRSRKYI